MTNIRNFGSITGRLARDVVKFENSDGSHKLTFTVMADRDYKNADESRTSDGIPVEVFVRAGTDVDKTPYASIHKGDLVQVETTLRANKYTKNGEKVYSTVVSVESVTFLEPRSITQARLAKRVNDTAVQNDQTAAPAVAPAAAGSAAPEQPLPFAEVAPQPIVG